MQNSPNEYPKNFIEELINKIEDSSLSVFLRTSYFLDKNTMSCGYAFHCEKLNKNENKSIIEKTIFDICGEKVSIKFVLLDDTVREKYKEIIMEQDKLREKKEEMKQKDYDREWEKGREAREKEAKEIKEKEIKEKIDNRIPPKFKDAKIENSLKVVQDYCSQGRYIGKGLFLYGDVGTGKTYNVYALTKQLIMNNENVFVFNLPRLLNTIRASFSKQEAYNEDTDNYSYAFVKDMSSIEKLIDLDILVIDDIGAEKPSDWVAETLYYLINSRYEEEKTTIFTSNLSLDKLADRIGNRIVSRIAEMCDIYEMKGEDKRIEMQTEKIDNIKPKTRIIYE